MSIIQWLALLAGIHIVVTWVAAIRRGLGGRSVNLSKQAHDPTIWPFVSVIVPAWRERGTLELCIRSLRDVDYPHWEAIIVAGGPDGTYQSAMEACRNLEHWRVIEQKPRGKNAALNQGLSLAQGEIIVLLDADSQVSSGWLKALVAPIDETVATTGQPIPLRRTPITQAEIMEQIATCQIRGIITMQGNGSIAIHRETIERIGGFPEDVPVGVDWDLNARLAMCNVQRALCPKAVVKTERPATLHEYWHNEVRWRKAHIASLYRHSPYFFKNLFTAIANTYIYVLSWFTALFTIMVSMVAVTQSDGLTLVALQLWLVFILWIVLRRAALAIEVATYSHDPSWLKLVWVPPLLLCITLAAILPATLTSKYNPAHFKGPRLHRGTDHAS